MGRILFRFLRKTAIALSLLSLGTVQGQELRTLTATSWLMADKSGNILNGTNTNEIRSIASITKLMTVLVVLDDSPDLNAVITRKLYGRSFTRRQLIELALVKSNNEAAQMLCQYYSTGLRGCMDAMNAKAFSLGMYNTRFTDPTGLFYTNVSTAEDLIKLVLEASSYYVVVDDSNKSVITYNVSKNRNISFGNTNPMAGKFKMLVSKTGWISKSGGCIAMMVEDQDSTKIIIVLGSRSTATRIPEAKVILASN